MRNIEFIEDFASKKKGERWDGCEAQLASDMVNHMKVAVYTDEGERASFKLVAKEGAKTEFIVTDEDLVNDEEPEVIVQQVETTYSINRIRSLVHSPIVAFWNDQG